MFRLWLRVMFATKLKESMEKMCGTQRNFDDKGKVLGRGNKW